MHEFMQKSYTIVLDQNLRPITEEFEDKEVEPKITTGNALRRQLQQERTKVAPVVEEEDDQSDVFGGALSTSRPLFTTTTPPRVVTRGSGLRQDRQKHSFINHKNGPAKFEHTTRAYEQLETQNHYQEDRNPSQQIVIRTTTKSPVDNKDNVRSNAEPMYVRSNPEAFLRAVPASGALVRGSTNQLEDDPAYRPVPFSRLLLTRPELSRLLPPQPLYSGTTDANVHYLADTPPAAQEQEEAAPRVPLNQGYLPRSRAAYQRQLLYPEGLADPRRPLVRPVPLHLIPDDRDYDNVPDYPYRSNHLALPPEPPNPIAPPLSRRDFQILLRRLLVSQYGIQALNYPRTYLEDALYDQQPYPSYQPAYQMPIPRAEAPYPAEPVVPVAPVAPVPVPIYQDRMHTRRGQMYARAINPMYQHNHYEDYPEPRYPKRVYRQKFYTPEVTEDGEEILPPQIREALLLRMLQLAINAERPSATMTQATAATTTAPAVTTSRIRKSGPVRSVQIIGDDAEHEKELRKKA